MSIGKTKNFLKDSEHKEVEYLFYPLTKKTLVNPLDGKEIQQVHPKGTYVNISQKGSHGGRRIVKQNILGLECLPKLLGMQN